VIIKNLYDYLDVDELAELIHGTANSVYYLNYIGQAPPRYRAGAKLLYKRSEVMAWIESRRVKQEAS